MPTVFIRASCTTGRKKFNIVESFVIWPHDKWFHPNNRTGVLDKFRIAIQDKLKLPANSYEIIEISLHLSAIAADNYAMVKFRENFSRQDYLEANILAVYEQQQQTIEEFLAESRD